MADETNRVMVVLPPVVTMIDGEKRSRENPATFEIPSSRERWNLKIGQFVKIGVETEGANGERFWVKVVEFVDSRFEGEICNDLVFSDQHGLECGDRIWFAPRHVLGLE